MKAYILTIDGNIHHKGFTTLRAACKEAGINYFSASRGKNAFKKGGQIITVNLVEVVRMRKQVSANMFDNLT